MLKPRQPLFAKKEDDGPKRDPRPGFDDVKQPKAGSRSTAASRS